MQCCFCLLTSHPIAIELFSLPLLTLSLYFSQSFFLYTIIRAVGSVHFVTTDFNPLQHNSNLKIKSRRLGTYLYNILKNILFIILNFKLFQELQILFLKALFFMMRFLVLNVFINCIYLRLPI